MSFSFRALTEGRSPGTYPAAKRKVTGYVSIELLLSQNNPKLLGKATALWHFDAIEKDIFSQAAITEASNIE